MLEFDAPAGAPKVPISTDNSGHPNVPALPADTRSETERRLTADVLRKLMATQGGSYTERATDHIIPGIKNVLSGGAMALGSLFGGEGTAGERWRAGVEGQKQYREQNREQTAGPLGYAADAAGFLGSMGRAGPNLTSTAGPTVAATERAAQTLPGAVGSGAAQGAISGAAENSQNLPSAIQGGVKGGITGGAVGAGSHMLTGLVGRALDNRLNAGAAAERAGQRGPSPEEYFNQAGAKFKELDTAGIQYDQGQARRLGGMLPQALKDANYTSTSAPELSEALKAVYGAGAKNAPPLTFTELQALRGKVAAAGQADPANANLGRIAKRVTGMIDEFIDKNQPNINQTGADLATLYPEARKLWRTGILGDTVQDMEKIAANKASVSAAGTSEEALARRAMSQQANKDIKSGYSGLPPEAEKARQAVIEGSPGRETVERISKSWPVQAGLGMLGAGAGSAMGLPHAGVAATSVLGPGIARGIGSMARRSADNATANNMDTLVRSIMTGSADKPASWDMPRDLLASLLARRAARSGAVQAAIPGGDYVINELMKNR